MYKAGSHEAGNLVMKIQKTIREWIDHTDTDDYNKFQSQLEAITVVLGLLIERYSKDGCEDDVVKQVTENLKNAVKAFKEMR